MTSRAGDLVIHNLGFLRLAALHQSADQHAFFLSRLCTGAHVLLAANDEMIANFRIFGSFRMPIY